MDKKDILREIIAQDGSCAWANGRASEICPICPLSRLVTNKRGDYLSCVEAARRIVRYGTPINSAYKTLAHKVLEDIEFEETMLGEKDET